MAYRATVTAIGDYVETTITLKERCLQTLHHASLQVENFTCWTIFSSSLSRKTSIGKVGLDALHLDEKVKKLLHWECLSCESVLMALA